MYLRLSRTRVDRAREGEVMAALRTWLTTNRRRPLGLLDLVFARRLTDDDGVEHVTVSLWTNRESMIDGLGSGWDKPTGLIPSVAGRLDDHRIEHFEVFADDWPELVAYAARRAADGDHEAGTREPGNRPRRAASNRTGTTRRTTERPAVRAVPAVAVPTAMVASAGDPDHDAPIRSRGRRLRCSMCSSTSSPGRRSAPSSIPL